MSFHLKAATGRDFVGRESVIKEVLKLLKDTDSTDGVCLYGLRRMGKTSLMLKLTEELQKTRKVVPVYFSLWDVGVRQLEYFSGELTGAVLDAYAPKAGVKGRIRGLLKESKNWVMSVLRSFELSVEIAEQVSTAFSLAGKRENKTPDEIMEIPFRLAEDIAKTHSCKSCLFLDEFPDLVDFEFGGRRLNAPIIAKVRTVMERSRHTSLSIAGSIRRTMNLAALGEASPFYRQFVQRELGPFDREAVLTLLTKNLKGRKRIGKLTDWMMENTHGIPFYVQCLGRIIAYTGIDPTDGNGETKLWNSFLDEEAPLIFRADLESLNNSERRVLNEAAPHDRFTFAMIHGGAGDALRNIGQWLSSLVDKGILSNPERGAYHFADPVFRRYLAFLRERTP